MGRELLPVVLTLVKWGDHWLNDGDAPPSRLVHSTCGESAGFELRCKACGEPVGTDVTVHYRPGVWATGRKTTRKRLRPIDS